MDNVNINSYFVSEKISKIRWIPEKHSASLKRFLTGSWDNLLHINSIKLWRLYENEYSDNGLEFVPKVLKKFNYSGDITALELFNSEAFLTSSSDGYVSLFKITENSFQEKEKSDLLHKNKFEKPVACNGLSIYDQNIATIGEDGKINVLAVQPLKLIQTLNYTDSCSLMAVTYINHNEIIASNRMGVIRIFDTRSQDSNIGPIDVLISSENDNKSNFATCLCYHPTQKHIVFAGSEEGSITIWDLRQVKFPASYLSAHSSPINEINFDKINHNKLLTCSEDGELWQYVSSSSTDLTLSIKNNAANEEEINPWLNGERTKSKVNVTAVINDIGKAVNSFDSLGAKILCACDNEAVYYIDNMF